MWPQQYLVDEHFKGKFSGKGRLSQNCLHWVMVENATGPKDNVHQETGVVLIVVVLHS